MGIITHSSFYLHDTVLTRQRLQVTGGHGNVPDILQSATRELDAPSGQNLPCSNVNAAEFGGDRVDQTGTTVTDKQRVGTISQNG